MYYGNIYVLVFWLIEVGFAFSVVLGMFVGFGFGGRFTRGDYSWCYVLWIALGCA